MTDSRNTWTDRFRSTHPEFDVEGLLDFAKIDIAAALWDPFSSPRLDTYATYAGGDLNAHDDLSRAGYFRSVIYNAYNTWLRATKSSQKTSEPFTSNLIHIRLPSLPSEYSREATDNAIKEMAMANGENWECSRVAVRLVEGTEECVGMNGYIFPNLHVRHLPYPVLLGHNNDDFDFEDIDPQTCSIAWPGEDGWTLPIGTIDGVVNSSWDADAYAAIESAENSPNKRGILHWDEDVRYDLESYNVTQEWAALPYFDLFFKVLQKMGHPLWGSLISEMKKHGDTWSQKKFVDWLNHSLIIDGNDSESKLIVDRDLHCSTYRPLGSEDAVWDDYAISRRRDDEALAGKDRDELTKADIKRLRGAFKPGFTALRKHWYLPHPVQQLNLDRKKKYAAPYYVTPALTSYIHFLHLMWCAEDYAARQGKTMDEFDPSDPPPRELAYRLTRVEMRDGLEGEKKRERAERAEREEKREANEVARKTAMLDRRSERLHRKRENKRLHALKSYGPRSGRYLERLRELGYDEKEIREFIDGESAVDSPATAEETPLESKVETVTVPDESAPLQSADIDYVKIISDLTDGLLVFDPETHDILLDGVSLVDLETIIAEANDGKITRRAHKIFNVLKYKGMKISKMIAEQSR